jgi:hypothetical protein
MKKIIMTLTAILGFAFFTTAQERPTLIDSNDDVQDKIQQEPTRDNQREIERNAKRAAEEKARKEKLEEAKKNKNPNKDIARTRNETAERKVDGSKIIITYKKSKRPSYLLVWSFFIELNAKGITASLYFFSIFVSNQKNENEKFYLQHLGFIRDFNNTSPIKRNHL